jgi:hypothetical protein
MSLTAFKNKSVIQYGSKRSGIAPGGYWLPQGPFGHATSVLKQAIQNYGPVGFSINGGHRNIGGVGQDMKMSKSGTPFRGTHPIGWGGTYGAYPYSPPTLNAQVVDTLGQQYRYIKPSTLSTYGMLQKKYKWAYYGKYPNYWVQPNYTGNQTDTASQWLYIQNKSAANICSLKVNDAGLYVNHRVNHGPTLCSSSTAGFKFNDMTTNAPYTKILRQPVPSSTYTQYIQRGCQNPIGPQKPFPYAVTSGSGYQAAGTSITSFGTSCNLTRTYLTPPPWYTAVKPSQIPQNIENIPQFIPFTANLQQ